MKRLALATLVSVATLCVVPLALSQASNGPLALKKATDCGTINIRNNPRDARVLAHKVRCKQARRVAKYAVGDGPQPKGWICSASLGRCAKGDFSSTRWVKVKWE